MTDLNLLRRLRDLMRAVDGKPYLEGSLHELMECLIHAFPCQTVALMLLDSETELLNTKISRGLSHRFMTAFSRHLGSGCLSTALWKRRTIVVDNPDSEEAVEMRLEQAFTAALAAPVLADGLAVGYLHVDRGEGQDPFSPDEILFCETAGLIAGRLVAHYSMSERLHQLEPHDPVTGVLRYSAFIERLGREFQRSVTYNHPVGILLLDVEGYGRLLDYSGAEAARDVLRRAGNAIQAEIRGVDIVGRYGADEFIVGLTDTDVDKVGPIVHSIREALSAIRVAPFTEGMRIAGGALCLPDLDKAPDLDGILHQLRANLLRARRRGGNRIVMTSPGETEAVEL